jgi:hypothetical protein
MAAPMESPPVTTFRTPGGRTSAPICPSSRVESRVKGEGLMTTVLPARSAGPTFQLHRPTGPFHGVIVATTPIGRWATSTCADASAWTMSRGISRSA